MAKRSKQYSFHLNLDIPDHLKVYRTLEDLNTDIHRSISSFVGKALVQYINGASKASLTINGKDQKDNLEGFITRQELGEMKLEIKAEIMKEVAELFGNTVLKNQQVVTPDLIRQMMELMPAKNEQKDKKDVKNEEIEIMDDTLEEMSVLFAQGNFGEE